MRWLSGQSRPVVRLHLCPSDCPGTPEADDLIHLKKVQRRSASDPGWVDNMKGASGMEELRRLAERSDAAARATGGGAPAGAEVVPVPEDKEEDRESSESSDKKKKRHKKKKRKAFKVKAVQAWIRTPRHGRRYRGWPERPSRRRARVPAPRIQKDPWGSWERTTWTAFFRRAPGRSWRPKWGRPIMPSGRCASKCNQWACNSTGKSSASV